MTGPLGTLGAALLAVAALAGAPAPVAAQAPSPSLLTLLGSGDEPAPPWAFAGLPQQSLPRTAFAMVSLQGERVLQVRAQGSYGNLLHPLPEGTTATRLAWRWRVDEANPLVDLSRKAGDDTSVKVCVLFDLSLDRVPFIERQMMKLARSRTGQDLPAATLCYLWEPTQPAGRLLDNVFSRRVRYLVLRGAGDATGAWQAESRDLRADFARAFGDESPTMPPLRAVAVGADADNTGGRSLAHVAAPVLLP